MAISSLAAALLLPLWGNDVGYLRSTEQGSSPATELGTRGSLGYRSLSNQTVW